MATSKRPCSQCGKPNAVPPKRLCPTCKRKNTKASAAKARLRRVEQTYGLSPENYQKLLDYSDGCCYICGGRSGRNNLPVDHDHKLEGLESVRGILCQNCNHWLLGRIGKDDPDRLERIMVAAIEYLRDPPAQRIFNSEKRRRK